jgi:hypothetical protein
MCDSSVTLNDGNTRGESTRAVANSVLRVGLTRTQDRPFVLRGCHSLIWIFHHSPKKSGYRCRGGVFWQSAGGLTPFNCYLCVTLMKLQQKRGYSVWL